MKWEIGETYKVHRRPHDRVGQCGGHIVGCDWLHPGRRQADLAAVGARSGNGAQKLEELRGTNDGVGHLGGPNQRLLWATFARM
jgi:hypothetical protein